MAKSVCLPLCLSLSLCLLFVVQLVEVVASGEEIFRGRPEQGSAWELPLKHAACDPYTLVYNLRRPCPDQYNVLPLLRFGRGAQVVNSLDDTRDDDKLIFAPVLRKKFVMASTMDLDLCWGIAYILEEYIAFHDGVAIARPLVCAEEKGGYKSGNHVAADTNLLAKGDVASKKVPLCTVNCFRADPVCGSDGVTYWCGAAEAKCAEVEVAHEGYCDIWNGGVGAKGLHAAQSLQLVHMVWLVLAGLLIVVGLP